MASWFRCFRMTWASYLVARKFLLHLLHHLDVSCLFSLGSDLGEDNRRFLVCCTLGELLFLTFWFETILELLIILGGFLDRSLEGETILIRGFVGVELSSQEEKYNVKHKKKLPECREVTKDNCVTDWE